MLEIDFKLLKLSQLSNKLISIIEQYRLINSQNISYFSILEKNFKYIIDLETFLAMFFFLVKLIILE